MRFDIITIFPDIFDSYFKESLILRAQKKRLIHIKIHNLRDFTFDKHHVVDDRPFGGGFGMVMKIEPIFRAVNTVKKIQNPKSKTILFTPRGKKFNQKMAYQLSKNDQLILICGRYEGFDERVAKIADMELSIGDYVLMGGELPAMVVVETIARLIPGVIGKPELLKERIPVKRGRGGRGFIEYPQYTRPEVFSPKKGVSWKAPKVLLSGNQKKIEQWRKEHRKIILS
ncbi:MAG: tRNA (guanosine(37)-N1)-methyltransferase TrmD [Minisyncoccales bacterium]